MTPELPSRTGASAAHAPTEPSRTPRPDVSAQALAASRRTVSSYERYAPEYLTLIDETPPDEVQGPLRRMVKMMPAAARVLEVGSGPGRDADFLESLGVQVRRTDATRSFLELQAARGKKGELLNLLIDPLGGPYDGVLALCTLIHIDRVHTPFVLRKIAHALRDGGVFLVSLREGMGETTGDYQMTYWSHATFASRLEAAGFRIEGSNRHVYEAHETWMTFLCRRSV